MDATPLLRGLMIDHLFELSRLPSPISANGEVQVYVLYDAKCDECFNVQLFIILTKESDL